MLIHSSRKIALTISSLALAALLCSAALFSHAAEQKLLIGSDLGNAEQLAAYRQQIEDLEFEFGPYHISLIEPLESMIELLNEDGDHEQVEQLQSRQLQVMRTELGFENPDLIPLLQSITLTQLALGNWEDVSEQLEHIRHLHTTIDGENTELLLAAIQNQIDWLSSRIAIDDAREQARNFLKTRGLYKEMEDIVENSYGEDSIEAAPWLYKVAHNEYHLVRFLNASDGLGSESIDELVRQEGSFKLESQNNSGFGFGRIFGGSSYIPVLEEGELIGDAYLRDAYSLIKKIQDVTEENSDIEAQAMLQIYRSDYQLLSDRGAAIRGYRDARDMLLEAGIAAEDVRWFFERPMLIPMETLHLNFSDALAELRERIKLVAPVTGGEVHLGVFNSWTEALGSTPMPKSKNPLWYLNNPFKYADVSFSVSSRGKVSSVDVLATGPEELDSKGSILRAIRGIQFRPALIGNKAKRMKNVHMRYQFIDE
tara:strand:- start:24357 stop:25805 length:1449 start_codon:yes stop_codon:yes gene_type:complete